MQYYFKNIQGYAKAVRLAGQNKDIIRVPGVPLIKFTLKGIRIKGFWASEHVEKEQKYYACMFLLNE